MNLDSQIRELKGVGEKTETLFQNLGVYTVRDILLHFPREYHKFEQPKSVDEISEGTVIAVLGRIKKTPLVRRNGRMAVTSTQIEGREKILSLIWFRMPYLKNTLKPGMQYVFYGIVKKRKNQLIMEQPKIYTIAQYQELSDSLQPVYALTKGLTNNLVRKMEKQALESICLLDDFLPEELRETHDFCEYGQAVRQMHFPDSEYALKNARNRLAYQDFFEFILMMQMSKEQRVTAKNQFTFEENGMIEQIISKLPYPLTGAQKRTIDCIHNEMRGDYVMQRLIQGDVGSGKTIVAFLAMIDAASNGYQSAIMAPTEVLAMQHAAGFREMCADYGLPYQVVCLTGSMTASQKKKAYEIIATRPQIFVVGTHALIQEKVDYLNLALVVTDEQHRFGVKQRESLSKKGMTPHMLVMSATPIPRTLAMILYGNMQISAIHELPADRIPIKTCVIKEDLRQKAYEMIGRELAGGHQAYIICPLVEASEQTEAENVTDYVERIRPIFGAQVSIAALHGKMPPKEKNAIMQAFAEGKTQILVSTTVVEVGVNVPNATLIMIEDANRFGLAQLHQLRGRVGRGKWQSYCILMDKSKGKKKTDRLEVMHKSNDGFFIAQEDLRLRGPGDFFGIRQSGELGFRLADIIGDADLLQKASQDVADFLKEDESLKNYPAIRKNLSSFASDNNMIL